MSSAKSRSQAAVTVHGILLMLASGILVGPKPCGLTILNKEAFCMLRTPLHLLIAIAEKTAKIKEQLIRFKKSEKPKYIF